MGVVDGISSIWKFCQISSCEILGTQKNIFSRSTRKRELQQCPREDVKVRLSSLTVKPSQIQQNLAIPVQIAFDRFYRQNYCPRATWCNCANFYLKWLRVTPKLTTSNWKNQNRWISSILVSWYWYWYIYIYWRRSSHLSWFFLQVDQPPFGSLGSFSEPMARSLLPCSKIMYGCIITRHYQIQWSC